jgi:hypothetical protein
MLLKIGGLACALIVGLVPAVAAARPMTSACPEYPWHVSREVALFAGASTRIYASVSAARAPIIRTDHLYAVRLAPEPRVRFVLPPGRAKRMSGDRAGLLRISVPAAGLYRISLDERFWIDVVAEGRLLPATEFHGSPHCAGPHKMVEFALPRGTSLLQLSGYHADGVRLTVTAAPHSGAHP